LATKPGVCLVASVPRWRGVGGGCRRGIIIDLETE